MRNGATWGVRLCILALGAFTAACGASDGNIPKTEPARVGYRIEDGFVVGPDGHTLILRGLNYANDHKFPGDNKMFLPEWESAKDFKTMAGWGFNSVRLLLTWEAVEPQRGVYDEAFLDALEKRLDWAQAAGVRVILDMHQDIFAREFGGDGAPHWAVLSDDIPFTLKEPWYLNFGEPAVMRAMDNFFADKEDVREHFLAAWVHVAERFHDHPALLGYDLLNEPFPGSKSFNVKAADTDVLNPFYATLIARLAAVDQRNLFFMEPNAVRTNVLAGSFPSLLAVPPEAEGRLVFSPHLYDPVVTSTGKYDGKGARLVTAVGRLQAEAERLGAALWVGEWSVWDGKVEGYDAFLRDQIDAMDTVNAGWSFWNYSLNPGDRTAPTQSPEFLNQLARPLLSAVAGRPDVIQCQPRSCRFQYTEKRSGGGTEIWVPAVWAKKFTVAVIPDRAVTRTPLGTDSVMLTIAAETGDQDVTVEVGR